MKNWKVIRNITISILIASVIPILWWLTESIIYERNGISVSAPGPSLVEWYDIFMFNAFPYLLYIIIPVIIDIVVLIISIKKLKNNLVKILYKTNYNL